MNAANLIEACQVEMILAITAREKWSSASNGLNSADALIPKWFIITVGIAFVSIVVLSIAASYKCKAQKK